jgi:hypothetical protein
MTKFFFLPAKETIRRFFKRTIAQMGITVSEAGHRAQNGMTGVTANLFGEC